MSGIFRELLDASEISKSDSRSCNLISFLKDLSIPGIFKVTFESSQIFKMILGLRHFANYFKSL